MDAIWDDMDIIWDDMDVIWDYMDVPYVGQNVTTATYSELTVELLSAEPQPQIDHFN